MSIKVTAPLVAPILNASASGPARLYSVEPVLMSSVSVLVAVYTNWRGPEFSSMASAIVGEVKVGATSSRSLITRDTVCSELLPSSSVATTVNS